tara:strand:+ start:671 stop:1186 length:516 start_codon:yes stop_codon:yes gene_type:complete
MKKLLLVLLVALGLQTQAQILPCDSISYTITSGSGGNTTLQLNGILAPGFPGIVSMWEWQVCDDALCFGDSNQSATFTQFTTTDTLKVCLTTLLEMNNMMYSCMQCDSLVYDGFGGWMLLNMGNPTGIGFVIEEDGVRWYSDKTYDMLGRELNEVPVGVMYIRNRKLYIRK